MTHGFDQLAELLLLRPSPHTPPGFWRATLWLRRFFITLFVLGALTIGLFTADAIRAYATGDIYTRPPLWDTRRSRRFLAYRENVRILAASAATLLVGGWSALQYRSAKRAFYERVRRAKFAICTQCAAPVNHERSCPACGAPFGVTDARDTWNTWMDSRDAGEG